MWWKRAEGKKNLLLSFNHTHARKGGGGHQKFGKESGVLVQSRQKVEKGHEGSNDGGGGEEV